MNFTSVGLQHYLIVAAALFVGGVLTILLKRNAIGILVGVELVLNAAALNLVAFNRYSWPGPRGAPAMQGEVFALFVIVLAAAEAVVALGIFLNFYNNFGSVDVERGVELRG